MPRTYYLSIRTWDKYQHYHNRGNGWVPTWIKMQVSLLDDPDFAELTETAQLLFIKLLFMAARTSNHTPLRLPWLSQRVSMDPANVKKGVALLVAKGFVERCEVYKGSRGGLEQNRIEEIEEKRLERVEGKGLADKSAFKIPELKDVSA